MRWSPISRPTFATEDWLVQQGMRIQRARRRSSLTTLKPSAWCAWWIWSSKETWKNFEELLTSLYDFVHLVRQGALGAPINLKHHAGSPLCGAHWARVQRKPWPKMYTWRSFRGTDVTFEPAKKGKDVDRDHDNVWLCCLQTRSTSLKHK